MTVQLQTFQVNIRKLRVALNAPANYFCRRPKIQDYQIKSFRSQARIATQVKIYASDDL